MLNWVPDIVTKLEARGTGCSTAANVEAAVAAARRELFVSFILQRLIPYDGLELCEAEITYTDKLVGEAALYTKYSALILLYPFFRIFHLR